MLVSCIFTFLCSYPLGFEIKLYLIHSFYPCVLYDPYITVSSLIGSLKQLEVHIQIIYLSHMIADLNISYAQLYIITIVTHRHHCCYSHLPSPWLLQPLTLSITITITHPYYCYYSHSPSLLLLQLLILTITITVTHSHYFRAVPPTFEMILRKKGLIEGFAGPWILRKKPPFQRNLRKTALTKAFIGSWFLRK